MGVSDAQVNLGALYANGHGVAQDYIEAYKWFSLATLASGADVKNFGDARAYLNTVANRINPDEVAEAQKRAREWMEAFEKRKQRP